MANPSQDLVNAFFDVEGTRREITPAAKLAVEYGRMAAKPVLSRPFSIFVNDDVEAASMLVEQMVSAAETVNDPTNPETALIAALEVAAKIPDRGLAEQAAKLFVTHHPVAAQARLPNLMSRMTVAKAADHADGNPPTLGGTTNSEEDKISWFREDPLLNEHHEHWHLVYWRFDLSTFFKVRPRHGELFFYMHAQMLARYEAERLAAGLRPAKAFSDYSASLGPGYDPGELRIGGNSFTKRPANSVWDRWAMDAIGSRYHTKSAHEALRNRFYDVVARGGIENPLGGMTKLEGSAGSDLLGDANEPSVRKYEQPHTAPFSSSLYGNHHGFGHMLTAELGENVSSDRQYGVMSSEAAAIRDPFFWRWHTHIDDLNFSYQQKLLSHDFLDRPDIQFGGGDDEGIVVFESETLEVLANELNMSVETAISEALGGDAYEQDATTGSHDVVNESEGIRQIETVDTIQTEMRNGIFQLATDDAPRFTYPYLWHRRYHFAIRLKNRGATDQVVTVRLYLCPAGENDVLLNNRRRWIELDKFGAILEPGENTILSRSDKEFTTIRRPVLPDLANPESVTDRHYGKDPGEDGFHPNDAACECGWPYHMLYPRGTEDGMRFALLAIITKDDQLAEQGQCGSMSFCSVAKDEYPDRKPMGYPFDRPLAKPMKELVAETPTMAMRFITIKTAANP